MAATAPAMARSHRSLKGIQPGRLKSAELLDVLALLGSEGRLDEWWTVARLV